MTRACQLLPQRRRFLIITNKAVGMYLKKVGLKFKIRWTDGARREVKYNLLLHCKSSISNTMQVWAQKFLIIINSLFSPKNSFHPAKFENFKLRNFQTSTANPANFHPNWAGLAVLFSRQLLNGSHDFFCFNILILTYSFKYKTIETHAREFLPLNISAFGSVSGLATYSSLLSFTSAWPFEPVH